MDTTTIDYIVTNNIPSIDENCLSSKMLNTSIDESILDLSQRPLTTTTTSEKTRMIFIDNWNENPSCNYTDVIDDADLHHRISDQSLLSLNIEQSLTDQLKKEENSLSDNPITNSLSQIDFYCLKTKRKSSTKSIVIHELEPDLNSFSLPSTDFRWSKYFSQIDERSVSEEFFDHYLASIESGLKIDMKIEYCYDIENDAYWTCQIQYVSNHLLRLHYLGIPDDETSDDFWALIDDQRCHPIGWCTKNSKSLVPPSMVNQQIISQENQENFQTPADYLFDKEIGLTPVEQIKIGMIFELQDVKRPWTLWFVRVINNRGGRLHLRYIIQLNSIEEDTSLDIHIFYLDRRVHPIGWSTNYSYELPTCCTSLIDKQELVDYCLNESKKYFYPPNLFKEQDEISKHRFTEGMKLEVFQIETKTIHIGRIGTIHNEFYFDVLIDNDEGNETSFVAHATHPHILPAHWAAEHKLALMNGKGARQTEDYWNSYTEKNGIADLAPERCFNLITLNVAGANQVEPGMKMEMIYTLNGKDLVFSMTVIHVADHLMWLRVDNPTLFDANPQLFYHVLPINSLDIFPIGWAKFNGFELITPKEYQMNIKTYERNPYDLFSSVTHYPKIPRVYLNEIYQLTIYVNIRCFSGSHFCQSRLARMPSQFGPGPYRHVLIDMFHHLLSASSTNAHRALRRLDHQSNPGTSSTIKTEYVKAAKKSSKLIRPISIPNEPRLVYQYLRHICTQLEACPNLISVKHFEQSCPDKCYLLNNTFAFSTHSKHKRTQLRAAQNRYRKQKSLLGHLKSATPSNISSPIVEEPPSNEMSIDNQVTTTTTTEIVLNNDLSQISSNNLPGSDRQTRGFRVHIEPKTHTVTRMNKKQKISVNIKQEHVEIKVEPSSNPTKEPIKRSRIPRQKRPLSPSIVTPPPITPVTLNILSSDKKPKKRRHPITAQSSNDFKPSPSPSSSSSDFPIVKVEPSQTTSSSSSLIRPIQYPIPPPIDLQNPITWNVNDVCWYLNKSGCSFALNVIKEQEIDGAALLLLDDLDTVQNLLEFKLGPAVKFFHVVEQLRTQVIDTFNSSSTSSLRTSSRLSTK